MAAPPLALRIAPRAPRMARVLPAWPGADHFFAVDGRELARCQHAVYELTRTLRPALFGEVRLARVCVDDDAGAFPATGDEVAVKQLELWRVRDGVGLDGDRKDIAVLEDTPAEIAVLAALSAPPHCHRIVRMLDLGASDEHIFIVLEKATSELFDHVVVSGEGVPVPEERVLLLTQQILVAVAHMHANGYAHMDLSLENTMLDGAGTVKVIDFGVSERLRPTVDGGRAGAAFEITPGVPGKSPGKDGYKPPEIVNCQAYYADRVDIWCVGVIALFMILGSPPWQFATRGSRIFRAILDDWAEFDASISRSFSGRRLHAVLVDEFNIPCSFATAGRISRMLALDPLRRPTAAELLAEMAGGR